VSNAVVYLQALHHAVSNQDVPQVVLNQHPSMFHAVQVVNKALALVLIAVVNHQAVYLQALNLKALLVALSHLQK